MTVAQPPLPFWQRMEQLLGAEYPAFVSSYHHTSLSVGLRLNLLKVDPSSAHTLLPAPLKPIPWTSHGFLFDGHLSPFRPGKHPYFAAGLYYLQEPSAMAVAELLNPQPGERVLDLCAAPGGKATHIATLMRQEGLLVANEIHPQRVWELVENLERWGVHNVVITQESPERLAEKWAGSFDRVLVDAPCSGEGMFRKSEAAVTDWSPELVAGCAVRQKGILDQAAKLIRPNGWLLYSTCTFAPEENEGVVSHFLRQHSEFSLVELPLLSGFSSGRPDWVPDGQLELNHTVHIFPHQSVGEGHFIALFHRDGSDGERVRVNNWQPRQHLTKGDRQLFDTFEEEVAPENDLFGGSALFREGSYLYQLPERLLNWQGLRVIRYGWWLGGLKKGRFEPSYALAMGLPSARVGQKVDWEVTDERVWAYLRGEGVAMREDAGTSGWTLITVNGYPLGWGKRVHHLLKNHYPKGLRWLSVYNT